MGDYGFDPLGLYPFRASFGIDRIDEKLTREEKIQRAKFDMELCEVRTVRYRIVLYYISQCGVVWFGIVWYCIIFANLCVLFCNVLWCDVTHGGQR